MTAVVDYGVGNLFSLCSSLKTVGAEVAVTGDPEVIKKADRIILPGVGAFPDAAKKLRDSKLDYYRTGVRRCAAYGHMPRYAAAVRRKL